MKYSNLDELKFYSDLNPSNAIMNGTSASTAASGFGEELEDSENITNKSMSELDDDLASIEDRKKEIYRNLDNFNLTNEEAEAELDELEEYREKVFNEILKRETLHEDTITDRHLTEFIKFYKDKKYDLGTIEYFDVYKNNNKEVEVVAEADISNEKNVKIVYDKDYPNSLIGILPNKKVVINTYLSDPIYLAVNNKLNKIDNKFFNEIVSTWDEFNLKKLIESNNDINESLNESRSFHEGLLGNGYEFKFKDIEDTLKVYLYWEGIIGYNDDILSFKDDYSGLSEFLQEEGIYGYTDDIYDILSGESAFCSDMDEEDFKNVCEDVWVDISNLAENYNENINESWDYAVDYARYAWEHPEVDIEKLLIKDGKDKEFLNQVFDILDEFAAEDESNRLYESANGLNLELSLPKEIKVAVDVEGDYNYEDLEEFMEDALRFDYKTDDITVKVNGDKIIINAKDVDQKEFEESCKDLINQFLREKKNEVLSEIDKWLDDDLDEAIEKHDELNQDIFNDNKLDPKVKEKIKLITSKFIEALKTDGIEIKPTDIVLLGSNASYNYTNESDLDIHIIADMSVYKDEEDLAQKIYQAYKTIFNNKYEPVIKGHTVEIYVEPNEISANSNGVYSITKDEWLKEPNKDAIPEVDMNSVDTELVKWEDKIDKAESVDDIIKLIDDLYILRQDSILKDGEYGIGNLVFKEMRNKGLLKQLKDKKVELENKEMSLESLQEKIVKKGSKYQVQSEKGRNMGTYDTKAEAEERLKQVEMFKHMNEDIEYIGKSVIDTPIYKINGEYESQFKSYNDLPKTFKAKDIDTLNSILKKENDKNINHWQNLPENMNEDISKDLIGDRDTGDRQIKDGINWVWFYTDNKKDAIRWFKQLIGSYPYESTLVAPVKRSHPGEYDDYWGFRIHKDSLPKDLINDDKDWKNDVPEYMDDNFKLPESLNEDAKLSLSDVKKGDYVVYNRLVDKNARKGMPIYGKTITDIGYVWDINNQYNQVLVSSAFGDNNVGRHEIPFKSVTMIIPKSFAANYPITISPNQLKKNYEEYLKKKFIGTSHKTLEELSLDESLSNKYFLTDDKVRFVKSNFEDDEWFNTVNRYDKMFITDDLSYDEIKHEDNDDFPFLLIGITKDGKEEFIDAITKEFKDNLLS